jgi:hypothetical protein
VRLVHNTVVSDGGGVFVNNHASHPVQLHNNLLVGLRRAGIGRVQSAGDLLTRTPGLADPAAYDWHLRPDSPAVDAGVAFEPGVTAPRAEYRHPLGTVRRVYRGRPDVGAHELSGARPGSRP